MAYQNGDCLTLPGFKNGFIAVVVTGGDEHSYHLAFFDYQGEVPPSVEYFDTSSLFVMLFGSEEQTHAAFDTVTIERTALESASEAILLSKVDLSGTIGLIGLTPMDEVADISAYFDQHYARFDSATNEEAYMPFKRSAMAIGEIRKRATPVNPFPTVKLYKLEHEVLRFWQIYGSPDPVAIVVSWGTLGRLDGHEEFTQGSLDTLKEKYQQLIQEKRTEGFEEREHYKNMILQFLTNDEWGASDDLGFRNQIWEILNAQLFWTGNGEVSGGDIGSGTVNLFFRAISSKLAVSIISSLLKERQINRSYLVALEGDAQAAGEPRVIYPEGYSGEFRY